MSLRYSINLACFFLAALPLSIGLSRLDRFPYGVKEKLEFYRLHRDEIDTLIIGSSYMNYGLDPRVFDEAMRTEGISTNTFNLSFGGSKGHEIDEVVRYAVEMGRSGALKRVIIDIRPYDPTRHALFEGTDFAVWWHSVYQTVSVLRSTALADLTPFQKADLGLMHIRLFIENHLPIGSGRALWNSYRFGALNSRYMEYLEDVKGFQALSIVRPQDPLRREFERVTMNMARFREETLARSDDLEKAARQLATHAHDTTTLDGINAEAWRSLTRFVSRHDVMPIYVLMPTVDNPLTAEANTLAETGAFPIYLSFNDPDRYPELFEMDARYERWHLNEEGAHKLSRMLGVELAARIRKD